MGFLSLATVQKAPPPALVPNCGECGLLKKCRTPKMAPYGLGNRGLLIVAARPSETADASGKGRPDGPAAAVLKAALAAAGIDLHRDCWLTYAQACRGTAKDATRHCRPLLLNRIKELQPKVVLLLGIEAVSSVIGHLWKPNVGKEMDRWAGWTIPAHPWNCWVCPTMSPEDVADKMDRNGAAKVWFERHVKQAVAKLKARPFAGKPPDYAGRCKVITDDLVALKYINRMIAEAEDKKLPVAWDLETNCLKPDNPEAAIACCSMASNGHAIAYPWTTRLAEATRQFLRTPIPKIASNMKFEDRWARRVMKVKVNNWWHDTMLAAHLLNNVKAVTSIKFQAFVHLGVGEYDGLVEPYLKAGQSGGYALNRVFRCDWPTMLLYNAMDSLLEYEVALVQRKLMFPKGG